MFFCHRMLLLSLKNTQYVPAENHTGLFSCCFVASKFVSSKFLQHKKAIRSKRTDGLFNVFG